MEAEEKALLQDRVMQLDIFGLRWVILAVLDGVRIEAAIDLGHVLAAAKVVARRGLDQSKDP